MFTGAPACLAAVEAPDKKIAGLGILGVVTGSAYDTFAADYHWIFSDEHISGDRFLHRYRDVLATLPPRAEVLDCACGTGLEAMALARTGLRVTACDASEGMVAEARRLFADSGLEVPVERCSWDSLAEVFPGRYDVVFCTGNSIAHSGGEAGMVAAFAGMSAVLRRGGVLVVESRDWEQMYTERPRLEVRDHVAVRDGVRGLSVFVWTIPESWGEPCTGELVLLLDDGKRLAHRLVELHFAPYRRVELTERLEETGFERLNVVDDRPGWYFVTATKKR